MPHRPLTYTFLDEQFDRLYQREARVGQIFNLFAGLAILIGCLGLFGLAAYTTEQRFREIGIRKVMGASITQIIVLLSKELVLLICVAFAIAAPLAFLGMTHWLGDFTYRTEISAFSFAAAGLIVLLIGLATMSYQSLRAALSNPVDSLKVE